MKISQRSPFKFKSDWLEYRCKLNQLVVYLVCDTWLKNAKNASIPISCKFGNEKHPNLLQNNPDTTAKQRIQALGKNDKCSQFAKSFTGNAAVISQLGRKVKRKTQGKELHANTTIMIGRLVSCSTWTGYLSDHTWLRC